MDKSFKHYTIWKKKKKKGNNVYSYSYPSFSILAGVLQGACLFLVNNAKKFTISLRNINLDHSCTAIYLANIHVYYIPTHIKHS